MQKFLARLGFLILAFSSNLSSASDDTSTLLQRTLHLMKYGSSLKLGFSLEKTRAGRTSALVEAVNSASDDEVEAIYARVLSKYLTLDDVASLLGFYTGPTGLRHIANESANPSNSNSQLPLSPTQMREVQLFYASSSAQKFAKITRNEKFQAELGRALEKKLLKSRDSSGKLISVSYADEIKNSIIENIRYTRKNNQTGPLFASFLIKLFPNGEILSIEKIKESGIPEYDKALENGILKSSPLPKKTDGTVERSFVLDFKDN